MWKCCIEKRCGEVLQGRVVKKCCGVEKCCCDVL